MIGAKVKEGNIKITISLPTTTNDKIRTLCKKQGDLSRIINEAINKYLETPILIITDEPEEETTNDNSPPT